MTKHTALSLSLTLIATAACTAQFPSGPLVSAPVAVTAGSTPAPAATSRPAPVAEPTPASPVRPTVPEGGVVVHNDVRLVADQRTVVWQDGRRQDGPAPVAAPASEPVSAPVAVPAAPQVVIPLPVVEGTPPAPLEPKGRVVPVPPAPAVALYRQGGYLYLHAAMAAQFSTRPGSPEDPGAYLILRPMAQTCGNAQDLSVPADAVSDVPGYRRYRLPENGQAYHAGWTSRPSRTTDPTWYQGAWVDGGSLAARSTIPFSLVCNGIFAAVQAPAAPATPVLAPVVPVQPVIPQPPVTATAGLMADFFNLAPFDEYRRPPVLSGTPVMRRIDPQVDFDWQTDAPGSKVSADYFGVRWHGKVHAAVTGSYLFAWEYRRWDVGVRITVDGQTVVDTLKDAAQAHGEGTVYLTGDRWVPIEVELAEGKDHAGITLQWRPPGANAPAVIPQSALRTG